MKRTELKRAGVEEQTAQIAGHQLVKLLAAELFGAVLGLLLGRQTHALGVQAAVLANELETVRVSGENQPKEKTENV